MRFTNTRTFKRAELFPQCVLQSGIRLGAEGDQRDSLDSCRGGANGLDGGPRGVGERPRVYPGTDQRERDGARTEFIGDGEGAPLARFQQRTIGLTGPAVGPNRVDHPARGHLPRRGPAGVARGEPVRKPRNAVAQHRGPTGPVDRPVDSASPAHFGARRVHHRVDGKFGDVALHNLKPRLARSPITVELHCTNHPKPGSISVRLRMTSVERIDVSPRVSETRASGCVCHNFAG